MQDKGIDTSVFQEIGKTYFGFPGAGISQAATGEKFILGLVTILLLFAAAMAVIFLVVGGYRYVTSSGNEELTEAAKKNITSSVIGLVIIAMAFAMVQIITTFLTRPATVKEQTGVGEGDVNILTTSADFTRGKPNSISLQAQNCEPCSWSLDATAPSWISLTGNQLSGTPPASAGILERFEVTAKNTSNKKSQTRTFQINIQREPGSKSS